MPIGVAVSGAGSCRLAGAKADLMIATEPKAQLGHRREACSCLVGGLAPNRSGERAFVNTVRIAE